VLLGVAVLVVSLGASAVAFAQAASDQAKGAAILQAVQQGTKSCSELTDSDFELIGEAWMGQALGSPQAHEAMNNLMSSMMGSAGENQMHQYMGHRASGCGGGSVPSGYGRMMSMMGLMGGGPGSPGDPGMMGAPGGSSGGGYSGPGSMMGGNSRSSDNGDNGPSAAAMVGMMAVLIGAVALALAIFRPWRHSSRTSREVLDRRFAAGELSAAEYRQAKELLEGDSK
jgi:hypothetical protein